MDYSLVVGHLPLLQRITSRCSAIVTVVDVSCVGVGRAGVGGGLVLLLTPADEGAAGHQRAGGYGAVAVAGGGGAEVDLQSGIGGRYLFGRFGSFTATLQGEGETSQPVERDTFATLQVTGHHDDEVVDGVLYVTRGERTQLGNLFGQVVQIGVADDYYLGMIEFLPLFVGENRLACLVRNGHGG